jgi:hypothetical protein
VERHRPTGHLGAGGLRRFLTARWADTEKPKLVVEKVPLYGNFLDREIDRVEEIQSRCRQTDLPGSPSRQRDRSGPAPGGHCQRCVPTLHYRPRPRHHRWRRPDRRISSRDIRGHFCGRTPQIVPEKTAGWASCGDLEPTQKIGSPSGAPRLEGAWWEAEELSQTVGSHDYGTGREMGRIAEAVQ